MSDPEEEADAVHRRFLPPRSQTVGDSDSMKPLEESSSSAATRSPSVNGSRRTDHEGNLLLDIENAEITETENAAAAELPFKTTSPPLYGSTIDVENGADDKLPAGDNVPRKRLPFQEEEFGFDFSFLKRFYRLHGLLFMSICSAASGLFTFLVCLVLLQEYIGYQVGLIASGFYKTLGDRDLHGFWMQTANSMGLIFAVAFVKSTTTYVQKVITVTFRKLLCEAAHRVYFADIRFYQLNVLDKAIDNPDQRITQDIDKFCTTYCDILPKILVSPFTIGYYCYQGYLRSGWQGPVGCFAFFIVSTSVNKLLMTPIVQYVVKQEKCEGDFRFLHMLVRVYSESIAFQQASLVEHGKVEDALKKLVDTQHSLYLRQYFLSFAINFVDYIGSIFSYLMLAVPIFSGSYNHLSPSDLGFLISQNAFILIYLIYTFTSLVDISGKFTDVAGTTHRIAQLLERLNALEEYWKDMYPDDHNRHPNCEDLEQWSERRKNIREKLVEFKTSDQKHFEKQVQEPDEENKSKKLYVWRLENVTFSTPTANEPLISNLNLEFTVGESVLITGTSSAGKSSILRVLRGLWAYNDGTLTHHYPPGPHGVYFCPQKAYLTWGSLREQISFPLYPDMSHLDDKLMLYYLDKLKLLPILERVGGFDVQCSWSVFDSLSPGEMQRICLLRIFYHQPVVAVLDEVTSALPLDIEEFVYSEFRRLGITLISVGHRESIRKYHDKQLIISSKGDWALYPIIHE